jgi:hypothetical protein
MDSPFLLHIQYLLTTMTCRFLRLSILKNFPRVADQAKNTVLKETLVHQILFHGKRVSSLQTRTL